ncbi:uncharacterized protein [Narcine bancroftii]|uniref:uncharacterized protein isoform X2 n=1 Tax=Narcine bancroftii TaxID=1343680 RepID=UPI003831A9E3
MAVCTGRFQLADRYFQSSVGGTALPKGRIDEQDHTMENPSSHFYFDQYNFCGVRYSCSSRKTIHTELQAEQEDAWFTEGIKLKKLSDKI